MQACLQLTHLSVILIIQVLKISTKKLNLMLQQEPVLFSACILSFYSYFLSVFLIFCLSFLIVEHVVHKPAFTSINQPTCSDIISCVHQPIYNPKLELALSVLFEFDQDENDEFDGLVNDHK